MKSYEAPENLNPLINNIKVQGDISRKINNLYIKINRLKKEISYGSNKMPEKNVRVTALTYMKYRKLRQMIEEVGGLLMAKNKIVESEKVIHKYMLQTLIDDVSKFAEK